MEEKILNEIKQLEDIILSRQLYEMHLLTPAQYKEHLNAIAEIRIKDFKEELDGEDTTMAH